MKNVTSHLTDLNEAFNRKISLLNAIKIANQQLPNYVNPQPTNLCSSSNMHHPQQFSLSVFNLLHSNHLPTPPLHLPHSLNPNPHLQHRPPWILLPLQQEPLDLRWREHIIRDLLRKARCDLRQLIGRQLFIFQFLRFAIMDPHCPVRGTIC